MRALALDTAVEACSLAYGEPGAALWSRSEPMTRGHAERLIPLFEDLKAELGWDDAFIPDRLVATIGPGTFTGARVALSAARAMALAWDIPCLGVSTLEALAASIPEKSARIAVIDARREQLYAQAFDADGAPLCKPFAESPKAVWAVLAPLLPDAAPVHLAGSGADLLIAEAGPAPLVKTGITVPDPAALLRFADDEPAARPPEPLYLRAPDAAPAKPPPWMTAQ